MVESKDGHYEKIKQGGIAMNAKKIVKKRCHSYWHLFCFWQAYCLNLSQLVRRDGRIMRKI